MPTANYRSSCLLFSSCCSSSCSRFDSERGCSSASLSCRAPGSFAPMSSTITMPLLLTRFFSASSFLFCSAAYFNAYCLLFSLLSDMLLPPSFSAYFQSSSTALSATRSTGSGSRGFMRFLRTSPSAHQHARAETTIIVVRMTKLTISVFVRLSLLYSAVSVSAASKAVSYFYFSSAYSSTSFTQLVSRLESVTPLIPVKLENPDKLTSRSSSVKLSTVSVAPSDGTPKVSY